MRRLLVVEDDPDLREALEAWFGGRAGFDVVAVDRAEAGLRAHADMPVDAIVLDLALPGADGLELLRALRADGDTTPVVIVTARGTEEQRIDGLESGADDYVVKPFSVRELGARVDAVLRRAAGSFAVHRLGDVTVDLDVPELRRGDAVHRLLPREAALLAFLLKHRGRTLSREQLLEAVWGTDAPEGTRTVDTHVFQLRQKLEADPKRPAWLVTVHRRGYRLRDAATA